ncbi:MAG: type II toxin-antitoxin system RelE/ParE family toxin [Acidobacteriota bacterium]|nr:type II toxin-antitoxin system RelE/ParE family toxin [Acidobacteriota bacterium]
MKYTVKYARSIRSDLKNLSRELVSRLEARIAEIEADPFDPRISKALKGGSGLRSSRVGQWRILYLADPETWWVVVDRIAHRSEVYRNL